MKLAEMLEEIQANPKTFLKTIERQKAEKYYKRAELAINECIEKLGYKPVSTRTKAWKKMHGERGEIHTLTYLPHHYDLPTPCAIYQPYGSQRPPDHLIIEDGAAFPIEDKTGKKRHPMWNSSMPEEGSLYLYCRNNEGKHEEDVTFFLGDEFIDKNTRKQLCLFWEEAQNNADKFNEEFMKNDPRGFLVYPRKMYEMGTKYNPNAEPNIFAKRWRVPQENRAIEFVKNIEKRQIPNKENESLPFDFESKT